jgi:hypothetical protein
VSGTFRELIVFLQAQGVSSRDIDQFVRATNIADYADRSILLIPLESIEQMIYMCGDADHILCVPNAGQTFAGALFTDISAFPVARFYHLRVDGDLLVAAKIFKLLKEHGFNPEIPRPDALASLVSDQGWEDRLKIHSEKRSARVKDFEKLRAGRLANTATGSAFFLNSSGCLVCDGPPECIASMTYGVLGEPAALASVRLCRDHMEEASRDSSISNYLARTFKLPLLIETLHRPPEEVLKDAADLMREKLAMDVFEETSKVIKGRTLKGTELIYRHEGPLNYGYMINSADNVKLARIDSANHHHVDVGPDHLHPDLQQKVAPISSFTVGDLCLDWPLLARLIADWEV